MTPGRTAEQVRRSETLGRGVRLGLVVYGVVHVIVAGVALQMAWGSAGGEEASQQGAFAVLADSPLGRSVLYVVALGFAALTVWQLAEAALGDRDADGVKRLVKRLTSAGKAVVYAVLAWSATSMALGSGSGGGDQTQSFTAQVMSAPGGRFLVGAVGVGIVAVGVVLGYRGVAQKFAKELKTDTPDWVYVLGTIGYLGKGVTLAAVGVLFVGAAVRHEPKESGGVDVALRELLQQPFGSVLLTVVALALAAYGAFCVMWARHLDR